MPGVRSSGYYMQMHVHSQRHILDRKVSAPQVAVRGTWGEYSMTVELGHSVWLHAQALQSSSSVRPKAWLNQGCKESAYLHTCGRYIDTGQLKFLKNQYHVPHHLAKSACSSLVYGSQSAPGDELRDDCGQQKTRVHLYSVFGKSCPKLFFFFFFECAS